MAGVLFTVSTGEIATGTSAKTMLQLVAASNHRVKVHEWSIAFKGINNAHSPVKVRLLRQSSAGTTSSLTVNKWDSTDAETLQLTAGENATVEPTADCVLDAQEIHPQTGYTWQAPFGRELVVPGGTRLGIEVTAANDVTAIATVKGEE